MESIKAGSEKAAQYKIGQNMQITHTTTTTDLENSLIPQLIDIKVHQFTHLWHKASFK